MNNRNEGKPENQQPRHSQGGQSEKTSSRSDVAGGKGKQTHENRENPERDHPTGHMGYNRHEHLDSIVTHENEE